MRCYAEEDFQQLSGLQHLVFCERQWGLIHLECIWAENRLTVEGKQLHERSDSEETEIRGNLRVARGLRIKSTVLGLSGRADVIEYHRSSSSNPPETREHKMAGVELQGVDGLWRPVPVEYKRGRPKSGKCDQVQLCAQALCLEEMLGVFIQEGFLYYGKTRRRVVVSFDSELRSFTINKCARLHELATSGVTPPARYGKHCNNCSLVNQCMPEVTDKPKSVSGYLKGIIKENADK